MTLVAITALFALGTSVLSWSNVRVTDLAPRFHWPDETTNHFFALRVARGESLAVPEPRNLDAGNIIHPRTMNVRADGALVPGSYLGLPLWYGVIGRVLGERAMLFFTPLLAALGLLAFASILRRFMGSNAALIATVLLALHPSVWLFTATALLPNVPFVALVLMSVAAVLWGPHPLQLPLRTRGRAHREPPPLAEGGRGGVLRWLVGGVLFGLALTFRTHEILWVGAMLAVLVWRSPKPEATSPKQVSLRAYGLRLTAYGFGIALPFVPILLLNSQLYGSPFTTGYALLQENGAAPTEFASSLLPSWLMALVAPFGWHPIEALARFWTYMVVPYPWFIALAIVGFATHILSQFRTKLRKDDGGRFWVVGGTLMLSLWLILYYGSWTIADPLVRETNVLTISYVRYWLPIVVVLAPWAALGFMAMLHYISPPPAGTVLPLPEGEREGVGAERGWGVASYRSMVAALMFLGIALTSFTQTINDPNEGLLRQRQAIDEHRQRARAVISATEPDAVIVSHRMDKVFFPERAVVHVSTDALSPPLAEGELEGVLHNLRTLLTHTPVYRYAPGEISVPGFTLTSVGVMPFGERLYRVE